MTNARGADNNLLPDAERLTPLGRFLRSTSLDELPELGGVLKGVGHRTTKRVEYGRCRDHLLPGTEGAL